MIQLGLDDRSAPTRHAARVAVQHYGMSPRRTSRALALALVSGLCACPGTPTTDSAPAAVTHEPVSKTFPREASAPTPEALRNALQVLGDRAAVVLVLRDAGWPETVAQLGALAPESAPALESPEALLRATLESFEIQVSAAPLRGRDPDRAIVLSMTEAPDELSLGRTVRVLHGVTTEPFPGVRHQLLVPARDPDALRDSLSAWFSAEREPWPELVSGRAGARAFRLPDGFIAVLPEGQGVRVVIVHTSTGQLLAQLRARLDATPVELPDTPATRQLGDPRAPFAALLRPWRGREERRALNVIEIHSLLGVVPPDQRASVLANAVRIALDVELMLSSVGVELDDWSVSVSSVDGTLHGRAVGSLTPAGRRVFAARGAGLPRAPAVIAPDDVSEQWLRADVSAMVAASERASEFLELPLEQRRAMWGNCARCTSHAILRAPFSTLGSIFPDAPGVRELLAASPRALQFVTFSPGEYYKPRYALAVLCAPGATIDGAATARGLTSGDARHAVTTRDDGELLLIGEGVEPAPVFDLNASVPATEAIAGGRVQLDALLGALGLPHPRAPGSPSALTLSSRVVTAGPTLVVDIVAGDAAALGPVPDFTGVDWASPMGVPPRSAGATCLRAAALRGREFLARQREGDGTWPEDLDAQLRCAAADVATAESAADLQRTLEALRDAPRDPDRAARGEPEASP